MELFRVAWRNVFRNRRRSVLNVVALTVGVAIMVIGFGWVGGYHTYIFGALMDFQTGQAQVLNEEYFREAARFPLDITVPDYASLQESLVAHPSIREAAGRVNFTLSLSNQRASIRLAGTAIEPERERRVTVIDEYISEGDYLSDGSGVLIGRPIAERLELAAGDLVFLTATDSFGTQNFVDARIAGIFDFGYPEIDQNVLFMDMASAADFLRLDEEVTRLAVRGSAGTAAPETLAAVREVMDQIDADASRNVPLVAEPWERFVQAAVTAIRADTFFFWLMLVIIFILIVVGIVNSMSMSVLERTGELGMLRALGMRRPALIRLIVAEGLCLSAIAVVAALLISTPIAVYLSTTGVNVSGMLPEEVPKTFTPVVLR